MYVGKGDAEDIIRWFQGNSHANWLGFFVAGDQKYNNLLAEVLKHGAVLDLVSGSHIDLFLFSEAQRINIEGAGRKVWVDAVPLTELSQGDDWHCPQIQHIGEINSSATQTKQIAKASTNATHRIAEILGLEVDDLPSLALIRKDFGFRSKGPKLVLRTRGQADAEFLIEFIRSMRRVMERRDKAASMRIPTEGSIKQDEAIVKKIKIEKNVATKFTGRAERQATILSDLLSRADIHIAASTLAAAILKAQSSEQGLQDAAADEGVEAMQLRKALTEPAIVEVLRRLEKDRVAVENACTRMERFSWKLPSVEVLEEYLALNESIFTELEALVRKFDRKVSFKVAVDRITQFFDLSTVVLDKTKKLIKAAAAVKSSGTSLLG